jgi:O-antigen ligase
MTIAANEKAGRMAGRIDGLQASYALILLGVFFVSFQNFRPADIFITYSDIAFLFAAALILLNKGLPLYYFGSLTPFWHLSFAVVIGALLISSLLNGAEAAWLRMALQFGACYLIVPMVLLGHPQRRWRTLAIAFVAGLAAMEIIAFGFLLYYDGDYQSLLFLGRNFLSGAGRFGAFLGNPNRHAAVIAMTLPILYYLRATRAIPAVAFYGVAGLFFVALLYTASNTGLAAAAVSAVLFFVIGGVRVKFRHVLVGFCAVVAVLVFEPSLPRAFEARVAPALETGSIEQAGTFEDRLALVVEAWGLARDNILVGVGAERYWEVGATGKTVHNNYLLLWIEGGAPAVLGWVGMLGVLFMIAATGGRGRRLERALALAVLAVFLIFTIATTYLYARIWMVAPMLALAPTLRLGWR